MKVGFNPPVRDCGMTLMDYHRAISQRKDHDPVRAKKAYTAMADKVCDVAHNVGPGNAMLADGTVISAPLALPGHNAIVRLFILAICAIMGGADAHLCQ